MNAIRPAISALAVSAVLAAPTAAAAGEVVPPGNSAATQYTEAIPTAGGPRRTGSGRGRERSPARVLGARSARELDSRGPAGRAVAEIAAETAPAVVAEQPGAGEGSGSGPSSSGRADERRAAPAQSPRAQAAPSPARQAARQAPLPGGSSGVGAVLAKATGASSSGGTGLLLPLALAATLAWAAAYILRRGRRPAP
jgi:hypothetical protein